MAGHRCSRCTYRTRTRHAPRSEIPHQTYKIREEFQLDNVHDNGHMHKDHNKCFHLGFEARTVFQIWWTSTTIVQDIYLVLDLNRESRG